MKTHQGPKGRVSPAPSDLKEIKAQADQAAQRKAALRGGPGEGVDHKAAKVKETPKKEGDQTPKGGGFWKRKRERWKKRKAKEKGKKRRAGHRSRTPPGRDEVGLARCGRSWNG